MSDIIDTDRLTDDDRGVQRLAEIGAGATRGFTADDAVQALPKLDGVGIQWMPQQSIAAARMYHDGDAYVLDEWPLPLNDDWDADELSETEAYALFEDGLDFEPVEVQ